MRNDELLTWWKSMAEKSAGKDAWRLVVQTKTLKAGAFYSNDGRPGLVIFSGTDFKPKKPRYASLKIISVDRGVDGILLVVELLNDDLKEIFSVICARILYEADSWNNSDGAEFLRRELSKWTELLRKGNTGMTEEVERGLFCELTVLEEAIQKRSPLEAIEAWCGPDEDSQDFHFNECSVEVKALFQQAGKLKISSLDQLDCNGPLFLAVVDLTKSEMGIHLQDKVNEVSDLLRDYPAQLVEFMEKLAKVGYSEFFKTVGSDNRYQITKLAWYDASVEGFPSIVRSRVSLGILDASYTITVPAMLPFAAESPL